MKLPRPDGGYDEVSPVHLLVFVLFIALLWGFAIYGIVKFVKGKPALK